MKVSCSVTFRLDPRTKAALEKLARDAGVSQTQFIERLVTAAERAAAPPQQGSQNKCAPPTSRG